LEFYFHIFHSKVHTVNVVKQVIQTSQLYSTVTGNLSVCTVTRYLGRVLQQGVSKVLGFLISKSGNISCEQKSRNEWFLNINGSLLPTVNTLTIIFDWQVT